MEQLAGHVQAALQTADLTGYRELLDPNVTWGARDDKILVGLSIFEEASSRSSGEANRWQILTVRSGLIVDIRGFEGRDTAVPRLV
jgi:hypothetical protein